MSRAAVSVCARVFHWPFPGVDRAAMWQSLADTARFNEAAGLPRHEIIETPRADGSVAYHGRGRQGRVALAWEEKPVNWVSGHWFEHLRVFSRGPLAELCARLELADDEDGCVGHYHLRARPANALGWLILRSGAFFRGAERSFAPLAQAARAYALGARSEPFDHPPPRLPAGAGERLQAAVAQIEASPFGHGLARRLATLIHSAQDVDVWHIRPLALARQWQVAEAHAIDLCLQAVRSGMLDLHWDLLCPRCRVAKSSVAGLDGLPSGAHCASCNIDYERDFSRNVEAVFRPAPAIRPLGMGEYCLFGPMSTPHIKVHVTVAAGQRRSLAAQLAPGAYRLRTLEPGDEADMAWSGGGFPEFRLDGDRRVCVGEPAAPGRIELVNEADRERTFVIESRDWVADALTADQLTSRQTFRDLFSQQTLRPGDDVGIARIALMFTDLKGSTALYERVGDAEAYHRVRDHFALLAGIVRQHDGALVKTIGDAVMAVFTDPAQAAAAALATQHAVAGFNAGHADTQIVIKIGLHCGPCIAVTMNDRLDYFGSTVNLAARLQGESEGGEIVVSEAMLADAATAAVLAGCPARCEQVRPKGFDREVVFHRFSPAVGAVA